MSDTEKNLCIFRQIRAAAEAADSGVELGSDSDITRAFDTPAELACKVGGCAITGQRLLDYLSAAGHVGPREDIDAVVAPSCVILNAPHDADRRLAGIHEEVLQPLYEV
jgi:hypothetical protein